LFHIPTYQGGLGELLGSMTRASADLGLNVDVLTHLYNRGNYPAVVGRDGFRAWLYEEKLPELHAEERVARLSQNLSVKQVTAKVAKSYGESERQLRTVRRGSRQGLESRKVAMYLCQRIAGATLDEIAAYFGLTHRGGVSFVLHQVKQMRAEDGRLDRRIEEIAKDLKQELACGGTVKNNVIELQGDHRKRIKPILIKLGFSEDSISD